MRCVGRFLVLVACLVAGTAQAQTADLSQDQIEQIRRAVGSQLAQNPDNRALRFRYAQASFQSGNYDAAKYHLRYLMRSSQSADELKRLQSAYATVADESPWSFGLNFSILPSTNINKTSSNEIFDTPLGQFLIVGGGVEESGVGLRFGGRVNYETTLQSGAYLTYGLELNRSQYPADRLNSSDGTVRLTWGQNSLNGFTQISPYVRRYVYDESGAGSADSMRYGIRLSHEYYLTSSSSITGSFTAERRDYDNLDYLDGNFYSTSLAYRGQLSDTSNLSLGLGISKNAPEQEHLRYLGGSASAEVTRSIRNIGTIGFNVGLGMRQYEGIFPAFGDAREDREASVGMSFRSQHIQVLDTSPKLSCRLSQNWSNVALYDYQSTDCAITFERNF